VKLKYIALIAVVIDLISISGSNAGGHIAHLGGAAFGFLYIRQLRKGRDLAQWVEKTAGWLQGLFRARPRLRVSHRRSGGARPAAGASPRKPAQPDQATVDRILEKISRAGYGSLTAEEKEILFRASNTKRPD
jgi:hypothetical protein